VHALEARAGPVRPDVPGARLEGVHVLRDLASARALDARLRAGATSALIVGMGPIGIEMAEALVARGLTVTVIGRSPRPLTRLARTPAGMVADAAAAAGVELRTPARLEGIEPDGDGLRVTVDGAAQTYSLVLFGTGVAPRAGLARAAGCALGPGGAVLVDRRGRTSVDGVWAAGDCATAWHRVLGRDVWIPLATTANRQGRVAGRDIAGLPARFPGVLGSWMSTAFGVGLGGTGLTEEAARGAGFSPRAIEREGRDRSGYVEGAERLWVRLVWDGPTGRLLGGQIGGRAPVGGRLHALSVAVGAELTVRELAEMDLGYVPPLSALRDPLQLAAAAVVGDAP
jgi:NADPH-dependent 2,4-dienoyl-CoA reductase/sulfur reductase-like enzyme